MGKQVGTSCPEEAAFHRQEGGGKTAFLIVNKRWFKGTLHYVKLHCSEDVAQARNFKVKST